MTRSSGNSHLIDQWAGRILAQGYRLTAKKSRLPDQPSRVGIIQPTAIGDTLISGATIRQIVSSYANAEISILHGSNNLPALRLLDLPVELVACNFHNPIAARRQIAAQRFDLIVDLTPWPYVTALCARVAPCTVGFAPPGSSRRHMLDIAVTHDPDAHETANLDRLRGLFVRSNGAAGPAAARAANCGPPQGNTIYLHPFAGGRRAREKSWPIAHWVELITLLRREGFDLCLTGGKADADAAAAIIRATESAGASVTSLCGKTSLQELAVLLANAKLLISVDTGVVHLASAYDACVLSLHGPTSSKRWGAWGSRGHSLDSPHRDAGYIVYGFESLGWDDGTMEAISPASVFQNAMAIIANEGRGSYRPKTCANR